MRILVFITGAVFQMAAFAQSFDHSHENFTQVLDKQVVVYDNNLKSAVNYNQLAQNSEPLNTYLDALSAVEKPMYQSWTSQQQLAFLINAYNGFTLKLIVDNIEEFRSGEAESIRDLGGLFSTPWEKSFFTLLGERRTLDWVEHEKIRVDFDEPRIHAALVCAAISCPKLRAEAFTAENLNTQLDDQMLTFLNDRDKNGIDDKGIYLSKIFDWYRDDFNGLQDYLLEYISALSGDPRQKEKMKQQSLDIRFVDYNWTLNSIDNR
ncbi:MULTISPECIES: DUF547 domain-containing protein [Idiomarina]|uniref:DUF547 domain-containing protein n=1 Tax=Idiomarina TaxID=135575 RepID=UPI0006C8C44E|nr:MULTISPECIES: DUF547 domain-containing protein [Idiomarina]KPD20446.1 hypothetical protein ADS78_11995 [Idiomarina abyssalis]SFT88397.1 Protein of unknown function, DUF547 [Idiomarina abyssalis]